MTNLGTTEGIILLLAILWSLAWKGAALWKAVKSGNKSWFIALLVVNTVGILEMLYIFVFSKMAKKKERKPKRSKSKKNA
jgi:hypothetical protein